MSPKTLILAYFPLIQYVLCLHFIAFDLVLQFNTSRHIILQEIVQALKTLQAQVIDQFESPEREETNLRSKLAEKVKKAEKGEKRGTPNVL
jgi:hypothetical protein